MIPDRSTSRIEALSESVIEACWLMALGLVPLLFNIYSSRNYEPDKVALLRTLVIVMVAAWLWKVLCGGRLCRPLPITNGRDPCSTTRPERFSIRALSGVPLVPQIAALAVLLVVGSTLSVDPNLSWLGSYPRAQGAWTELAYLAVFALVMTHLRSESQWRRVVLTVIVAGATVALYGVIQALGLDPVATTLKTRRVYSTLGNSIFLGAYLVMAVFLTTLEFGREIVSWWQNRDTPPNLRWWPGRRAVVVGAVLLLQLAALTLSQSRGPFLGLLCGAYIFVLVGLINLQNLGDGRFATRRWRSLTRWAVPGIVGAALMVLIILVVFNRPGSPLETAKTIPYVGRLGSVLDAGSRTIQVRLDIWRSVSDLLRSEAPIETPDGTPDRFHRLRPIIGTGPETLTLAVNRFVKPRLGQLEAPTKTLDRAHNQTFDLAVMKGAAGTVIWLAVFCSLCGLALQRMGLIHSRARKAGYWTILSISAFLGAAIPWYVSGEATLAGVGLSIGLVSGLAFFVTVQSRRSGPVNRGEGGGIQGDWLMLALLATFVAHMVEIQVGIAITVTQLYFWFLAAVTVLAARGWLTVASLPPGTRRPSMSRGKPVRCTRSSTKHPGSPSGTDPHLDTGRRALIESVLFGALCLPWIYSMTLSSVDEGTFGTILVRSWFGGDSIPTWWHLTGLGWLVLATISIGSALSTSRNRPEVAVGKRRWLAALLPAVGIVLLFAVVQAARIAHVMEGAASQGGITSVAAYTSDHFAVLIALLVMICLVLGALLSTARGLRKLRTGPRLWPAVGSGVLLVMIAIALINRYQIDPIRADSLHNSAKHLIQAGRNETAVEFLDRATSLSPREPIFQMVRGSAFLGAAATAGDSTGGYFTLAEASLQRALELAPLDPDHWANLARCLTRRANAETDRRLKTEFLERAQEHFNAAVRLRPGSVVFLNEAGRTMLRTGRIDEARLTLKRAVALNPWFVDPYLPLAAIAETSATDAMSRGDAEAALTRLQEAAAIYQRALEFKPDLKKAIEGRDRVDRAINLE